jgi:hypothetical protein
MPHSNPTTLPISNLQSIDRHKNSPRAAPRLLLAPLYGPAVRCKPDVNKWRVVLRFCIRPLDGAFVPLAIMDIR